ncbi:hypothetical protein OBBRIDRAFT_805946 [Obba rivulosa]|uniref:Uncharacterized protein n=1 Tax=Obba rivulosa TaxID=1052685 RepID=A0A8E2ASM7_9APHY|nr:hypothetical protein OBBRIDRAFT_805946 [Obba rivulosa]
MAIIAVGQTLGTLAMHKKPKLEETDASDLHQAMVVLATRTGFLDAPDAHEEHHTGPKTATVMGVRPPSSSNTRVTALGELVLASLKENLSEMLAFPKLVLLRGRKGVLAFSLYLNIVVLEYHITIMRLPVSDHHLAVKRLRLAEHYCPTIL